MIKSLWINLPVENISQSKAFFTALGFEQNLQYGVRNDSASFLIGDNGLVLMLFQKPLFEAFIGKKLSVNPSGDEVLFSFDAESAAEVDEIAKKVIEAGGRLYAKPGYTDEWMYGCGFTDLDGQKWNILYMDFSKMPLG